MPQANNGSVADRGPRLTRIIIRNYRSIAACDVRLGPLTFLVGPNGAGKSNFLDALRLVADGLRTSLDYALRDRGGVGEVRRRSSGHPTNFGIRIDFVLADNTPGSFAFEVGARAGGTYVVQREDCQVGRERYRVAEGVVELAPAPVAPPAVNDRLYLVNAAGLPPFRPVFDLLSSMGFYNLNPDRVRALQPPDKGELLARDGSNLASVLGRLRKVDGGQTKARVEEYLSNIVPGVDAVEQVTVGHMETLEFRQRVQGAEHPWRFNAINMSDGTLRDLGLLDANDWDPAINPRLEQRDKDPEGALHPAAAGLLRDALREGARQVQVIVTSHSPDLLDDPSITDEQIYAVVNRDGTTSIGKLDEATRSALRDRLYTAGEMLRKNQLAPDPDAAVQPGQLRLFDDADPA